MNSKTFLCKKIMWHVRVKHRTEGSNPFFKPKATHLIHYPSIVYQFTIWNKLILSRKTSIHLSGFSPLLFDCIYIFKVLVITMQEIDWGLKYGKINHAWKKLNSFTFLGETFYKYLKLAYLKWGPVCRWVNKSV